MPSDEQPNAGTSGLRIEPVKTRGQAGVTAGLARDIWMDYYPPIIGVSQVEYMLNLLQTPERIWQDITEQGYQYDLIEIDGKPAGYLAARLDPEKQACFLSKLYVDRSFRRRGLARLMLEHLITRSRQAGYHRIWLTVNKNNLGSIAVYEKIGFIKTDSVVQDIGGGYVMDDYVMELTWS